jgi:hypothetical protein
MTPPPADRHLRRCRIRRWLARQRQERTGTPPTPRAMTPGAGSRNIRICRFGCSVLPGSRPLMRSSTWAAAHPLSPGRCWTAASATSACSTSPRPGCSTRGITSVRGPGQVHWLTANVLSWHPRRHYQAWHDRAAYHFLTADEHRQQYLHTLDAATEPGAIAVFGCFAPDGPQYCSGLPVARYSPWQLARQFGARWLLISQDREEHITPAGIIQPFTWVALRRQS